MTEQNAPFDILGAAVVCHGQQILVSASSPGVCLACHGVFTIASLSVNYNPPSQIARPSLQVR